MNRKLLGLLVLASTFLAGCAEVSYAPTPDATAEQARIAAAVRGTLAAQGPVLPPTRTPRPTNTPRPMPTLVHAASASTIDGFEETIDRLDGRAEIYSADGEDYLGLISSDCFASESLVNQFGRYGSEFESNSILNEFGENGSRFSAKSAFNDFSNDPPVIMMDGEVVAYLTTNRFKTPRVDPELLIAYLRSKGNCR